MDKKTHLERTQAKILQTADRESITGINLKGIFIKEQDLTRRFIHVMYFQDTAEIF